MTDVQRLSILKSSLRSALISDEAMSAEDRASKTAELLDTEAKFQTAVALEATEAAKNEPVENRMTDLVGRVELRSYFDSYISEKPLDGPQRELNAELKAADNVIPWAAFAPTDSTEERADATTDISGSVRRTSASPLERIMATAASTYAGIQTVTVPAGERQFVAMSGGASGGTFARNAAVDGVEATFETVETKPVRGSIRYKWNLESQAVMPTLESALRRDAAEALRLHLDAQALNGNGTAPNPTGLISKLTASTNPTDVIKASDLFTDAVTLVDGLIATSASSVRMLIGPKAYQKVAAEQLTNKDFVLPKVESRLGGIRVSAQIPAPASTIEGGLAFATGNPASVFLPVWGPGPVAILDRYTESAKAITALTLHYLYNVVELRTSQYKRLAYKISA